MYMYMYIYIYMIFLSQTSIEYRDFPFLRLITEPEIILSTSHPDFPIIHDQMLLHLADESRENHGFPVAIGAI